MTGKGRNIISLLRELVKNGNELLEGTMADVTAEQAHWIPPGVAIPIGAAYAPVVISQDGAVNGMFKGGVPLFAAGWAGKTGVSASFLPRPIRASQRFRIGAVGAEKCKWTYRR